MPSYNRSGIITHPRMDTNVDAPPSFGQRCAELIAYAVGSWHFIITQTVLLVVWVIVNSNHIVVWDAYPFILLNLFLSLQAAYTAPMILMAHNRQNEKDRKILYDDYTLDLSSNQRLHAVEKKLDLLLEAMKDINDRRA